MTSRFHSFLGHLEAAERTPHAWKMACALFAQAYRACDPELGLFGLYGAEIASTWPDPMRLAPKAWADIFALEPGFVGFAMCAHIELRAYRPTDEAFLQFAYAGVTGSVTSLSMAHCDHLTPVCLQGLTRRTFPVLARLDVRGTRVGPWAKCQGLRDVMGPSLRLIENLSDEVSRSPREAGFCKKPPWVPEDS